MRMWMVDPAIMCRKHLLGEHVELHMFVGCLRLGRKAGRYASDGLLEFSSIHTRHTALVREMGARGYNHRSPLPRLPVCRQLSQQEREARVDKAAALKELLRRCPECRRNWRTAQ